MPMFTPSFKVLKEHVSVGNNGEVIIDAAAPVVPDMNDIQVSSFSDDEYQHHEIATSSKTKPGWKNSAKVAPLRTVLGPGAGASAAAAAPPATSKAPLSRTSSLSDETVEFSKVC